MSRESLPTFDLYAELEVSRSASVATIGAAYRSLAKRVHPDVAGFDADQRINRLNVARAWLTDPALRRRYDAVTAPRPAGSPLVVVPADRGRFPAVTRRVDATRANERTRGLEPRGTDASRTPWLAITGLGVSSIALTAVLALTLVGVGPQGPPDAQRASPFGQAVGGASVGGSGVTPAPTIDPVLLANLQAGAASTLGRLQRAARIGDLHAAQTLLGATAPQLTVSGLMRAQFPSVAAADISISKVGADWIATAGTDTLTSSDGTDWTFDYGERPLAAYGRTTEHQPYFIDPNGRHEIDLRVTSVVVSRSIVWVTIAWRFPNRADARAFTGDGLTIAGLTIGSDAHDAIGGPSVRLSGTASKATLKLSMSVIPATGGTIDVRVLHAPGVFGFVDTDFKLAIA